MRGRSKSQNSHHFPNVYFEVTFSLPLPSLLLKLPNDSVQLVCVHNGSLCLIAIEYNDLSHLIDSFQNGAKQALGVLDVIVTSQNGAKQNAPHAGC